MLWKNNIANENFLKSIKKTISGYLEILILDKKDFYYQDQKNFQTKRSCLTICLNT